MLGGWLNISNNLKSLIKNLICQHRGGKDKIPTVSCIPVVHKNKPETIKYQNIIHCQIITMPLLSYGLCALYCFMGSN